MQQSLNPRQHIFKTVLYNIIIALQLQSTRHWAILSKGSQIIAHKLTLVGAEIKALQEANGLKKRRERKRKRPILQGGGDIRKQRRSVVKRRRCGHNTLACRQAEDTIEVEE